MFRPTTGEWWGVLSSHNYVWQDGYLHAFWGMAGDVPVPGDYDGDGRSDLVVFRPTTGEWCGLLSSHNYVWQDGYLYVVLGAAGDIPAPGDYDSDGKTDPAVYRASAQTWYVDPSAGGAVWALPFGSVDQVVEYDAVDALGSVRAVTDEQGQVLRRHEFRPFGEEWQPLIPPPDARLFTGQERDVQTGFDYFGARYYRPDLGRFTTVDPGHVGANGADLQSWNAYAYARSNPIRYIDPTGTDYLVHVRGGTDFWYGGSWSEFQGFAEGFTLEGGPFSGTIYNAAGQAVGTYQYFDPLAHMLIEAGRLAAPGVTLAANGLRAFGWAVAAPMMAVAECVAGNCDKTGIALAMLPSLGSILNGARLARAARGFAAAAIYEKAGGLAQATADFKALAGAERTIGNVRVKELSDGSKAILRDFSKEGRPTLEIQHTNGQVTKVRYN